MGPGEHNLGDPCEKLAARLWQALVRDRKVESRRRRAHWGFVAAAAMLFLLTVRSLVTDLCDKVAGSVSLDLQLAWGVKRLRPGG
ncbi:MAG: hypothetical protein HY319_29155 [Armatimonadetes bacterium]|nr:hypothetical protein [Armatimonadota bacterium]